VHQGHCHLLRRLVELAGSDYLPTVLTFVNHPITVLRPETQVRYITSHEDRVRLLKDQGIELVVCLDFTRELSQVSAADFTSALVEKLRMKGLVVGPDSALGRDRQGDIDYLRRRGTELGFWVEVVDPLMMDGDQVKSRRIRAGLEVGDVSGCARLLGRKFSLEGIVVKGDQRGKSLGFPTANLELAPRMALPGDGIYATWTIIEGVRHPSATSIGVRPTFNLSQRLVEVYVMDFDADLYGKRLNVEFVRKLRDQETFPSVEELVVQIDQDVADSRAALDQDRAANIA
jgi:riboflavin kinase/FMN adenylyltransferase